MAQDSLAMEVHNHKVLRKGIFYYRWRIVSCQDFKELDRMEVRWQIPLIFLFLFLCLLASCYIC